MLRIDISTVLRVRPEDKIVANRILDAMDAERDARLSDWLTCDTRNPRGTMPQYNGFRADWYEYEEDESYSFLDNMDCN